VPGEATDVIDRLDLAEADHALRARDQTDHDVHGARAGGCAIQVYADLAATRTMGPAPPRCMAGASTLLRTAPRYCALPSTGDSPDILGPLGKSDRGAV
jgi:hypothetical protein